MRLFTSNDGLSISFRFVLFGLIAGWLVDLDHVVVLVAKGVPITLDALATQAGRPLHWTMFYLCGGIFFGCSSHCVRLLFRLELV